ncbi:MAG TPA: hypothetical protein VFU21_06415 [Kofleriaceae bacterium]|nr:hypothetical protein [Kofleriaceae bacterium]
MSAANLPVDRLLRLVAGSRIVFQTRHRGELAVARVLAPPVPLEFDGWVRRAVLEGGEPPAGLPLEQRAFLEGCRARASLGAVDGLPAILEAGVAPLALPGIPPAVGRQGHVHVIARWVEGTPLGEVIGSLPADLRRDLAVDAARLLARVHEGLVAHGSVDGKNLIVAGSRAWLVDLRTPRRVAAGDRRLADDVRALGRLREQLLGGDTVHVSDPTAFRASQPPAALDPPTEFVPDPVARPAAWSPAALLVIVVAILAPLIAWLVHGC